MNLIHHTRIVPMIKVSEYAPKHEIRKTKTKKTKYKLRREEVQQQHMHEGSSLQNSHVPSIDDNEIYFSVVGGESKKGYVYGLGTLRKKFYSSAGAPSSTSQAPVIHQMEEMCETIQKLNVELMAKNAKEKTLEEKVEHLLKNHAK